MSKIAGFAIVALLVIPWPAAAQSGATVQPRTLSAADAATVNDYLLPEYLPNRVSVGDVFGFYPAYHCVDIPVLDPVGSHTFALEIVVPLAK